MSIGINVRHLGRVRSHITNESLRNIMLIECVARVLKCEYRERMRETVKKIKVASIEPYKEVIKNFLNEIWTSEGYWDSLRDKVQKKFPHCLAEKEKDNFNLKLILKDQGFPLIVRFQQLTGTKIDTEVLREIENGVSSGIEYAAQDIQKISVKVKFMVCIIRSAT